MFVFDIGSLTNGILKLQSTLSTTHCPPTARNKNEQHPRYHIFFQNVNIRKFKRNSNFRTQKITRFQSILEYNHTQNLIDRIRESHTIRHLTAEMAGRKGQQITLQVNTYIEKENRKIILIVIFYKVY